MDFSVRRREREISFPLEFKANRPGGHMLAVRHVPNYEKKNREKKDRDTDRNVPRNKQQHFDVDES